jgi:hypothetical protein
LAPRNRQLIYSLLSGLTSACLTWLMVGDHPAFDLLGSSRFEWLAKGTFILVLPGLFAGFIVGGNVHVTLTWVVALANFLFYFGLVCVVGRYREKRRAKAQRGSVPSVVPESDERPR